MIVASSRDNGGGLPLITAETDSLTNIVSSLLIADGWLYQTEGAHVNLTNKFGATIQIRETETKCQVRGLRSSFEKLNIPSYFPTIYQGELNWYKYSADWEIFYNKEYFYLVLGEKLYFFGTCEEGIHVICGKNLQSDKLFYTYTDHPIRVAYSNAASFSKEYSSEVTLSTDEPPFEQSWISPSGVVVARPVSVYDSRKKSFLCHLPKIWALQNSLPLSSNEDFAKEIFRTENGKCIVLRKLENHIFGLEV